MEDHTAVGWLAKNREVQYQTVREGKEARARAEEIARLAGLVTFTIDVQGQDDGVVLRQADGTLMHIVTIKEVS